MIQTFDRVLDDPLAYRASVAEFRTVEFGDIKFHGIAPGEMALPNWITLKFPSLKPTLTFFRKSPYRQEEPNYIHDDRDMGDWTAILYLNENPPKGDGTAFWKHRETGRVAAIDDTEKADWKDLTKWEQWGRTQARFNRVLLFSSAYFHSRSLFNNYGDGNDARLIQVVFGTGDLGACTQSAA